MDKEDGKYREKILSVFLVYCIKKETDFIKLLKYNYFKPLVLFDLQKPLCLTNIFLQTSYELSSWTTDVFLQEEHVHIFKNPNTCIAIFVPLRVQSPYHFMLQLVYSLFDLF